MRRINDRLARKIGERDFGGGNEPEAVARRKLILTEFRQLRRAEHRLVAHQQRRAHLRVAVRLRMQIEHELRQRALKPRQRAFVHHETRAGNFRRRVEIHQAERLTEVEMLFRGEVKSARFAPARDFDIIVLVNAIRHIVARRVRERGERIVEFGDRISLRALQIFPIVLDRRDFCLQRLGAGCIAGFHRRADLFRSGVAALLRLLQFGDRGAACVVEGEKLHGHRIEPPACAATFESRFVLANPFDVVHTFQEL